MIAVVGRELESDRKSDPCSWIERGTIQRRLRGLLLGAGFIACFFARLAFADEVRQKSGTILNGQIRLQAIRLVTDAGTMEVPRDSLREISLAGSGFIILLTDGSRLSGSCDLADIQIDGPLYSTVVPMSTVDRVRFDPRPALVEAEKRAEETGFIRVDPREKSHRPVWVEEIIRLELPLDFLPLDENESNASTSALSSYNCSRASIESLDLELELPRRRDEDVGIEIEFDVYVARSHDKNIQVRFDLCMAGQVISSAHTGVFEAEEDDETSESVDISIPRNEFEAIRSDPSAATLRITMHVEDD